jgi:hypothetical protein
VSRKSKKDVSRDTIFTVKSDQYSALIDLRDTICTIKWDQYPACIDTRHYIYNKMRTVPSLYRHGTLYLQ